MQGRAYLNTGLISLTSRVVFIISTLGVLWLVAQILPKADFGLFILAQTLALLSASIMASGFFNVVLYHSSRAQDDETAQQNARQKTGAILILGFGASLGLTYLAWALTGPITGTIFSKPELATWLTLFIWIIPLEMLKAILVWWHRAEYRTARSVILEEAAPSFLRLLGCAFLYIMAPNPAYLVPIYLSAHAITILFLIPWHDLSLLKPNFKTLSRWDLRYGLKIKFTALLSQPARSVDILLAGAFISVEALADYTLASKLAIFLLLGKQALLPLLTPRMGKYLATQTIAPLLIDFYASRFIGLIICLIGLLGFLAFGPWVLSYFGDFQNAYPLFLLLSVVMMIRTAAGADGEYLNMAGYAGWKLVATLVSLITVIGPGIILMHILGAPGAAYASMISMFFTHGLIIGMIYKLDRVWLIDVATALSVVFCATLIILTSLGFLSSLTSGILLGSNIVLYAYVGHNLINAYNFLTKNNA